MTAFGEQQSDQEIMLHKVQEVLIKLHEKDPDLYQYPFSKENWMHLIDAGIIASYIPV